jgi:transcriptional regulator with XRE-family HTH domain
MAPGEQMSNVGDLGRRVAERRRALGLSSEAVATRAGMNPSYLQSLEQRAAPQLSRSALLRLAAALDTTIESLTGSGVSEPPGQVAPPTLSSLSTLDREACEALISTGGVGRVVFHEPRGPVAFPTNFRMLENDVVLRTAPSAALMESLGHGPVSFEVDHIDDALGEGWSVLISGRGHMIVDPAERRLAQALGVTPWAGGDRNVYVRIVPDDVTGRRIRRP